MYGLEWETVLCAHKRVILCLFAELQTNEGNKHQNNPKRSALTVCHDSTYIILFLGWHYEPVNDLSKRWFSDIDILPHLICLLFGDDITIDCETLEMMSQLIW